MVISGAPQSNFYLIRAMISAGVVLPYISHIGISTSPKGKGFCAVLVWTEMGIDFIHFDLESGMVFEGTTGIYERMYRFNSKCVRQKEKYVNWKRILRSLFCCCSNLSNDDIFNRAQIWKKGYGFWRPNLKTSVKNDIFWFWNWVRFPRTEQHTPTKNSKNTPPDKCAIKLVYLAWSPASLVNTDASANKYSSSPSRSGFVY